MSIATPILQSAPILFSSASSPPRPCRNPKLSSSLRSSSPPLSAFHGHQLALLHIPSRPQLARRWSSTTETPPNPVDEEENEENELEDAAKPQRRRFRIGDWTTSILLFGFYAAVVYYVTQLSPNQTPFRDMYFLKKLLYLKGDDGFRMNEVLVALWYLMGLWPLLYSMLLLPTGRSSKGSVPLWPFLSLSFGIGAFALIPYFILWTPPPPPVEEEEIGKWPLNFLESKITAGIALVAVLGLFAYAGLADGSVWKEFYQYFRESRLVHATSTDFMLLTAFSAFWVYNDMTARRFDKGRWLLPFALIPCIGPALYIVLRPSLSALPTSTIGGKD